MKHKDIRRRGKARIELERELLPLIIALALFIAASAVSAAYVNLPNWLTVVMGVVPPVAASFAPLRKAGEKLIGGKVLSYDLLIVLACIGTGCMRNFTEAFFVLVAFDLGSCFELIFAEKNRKRTPYLAYLRPYSPVTRIFSCEPRFTQPETTSLPTPTSMLSRSPV